MGYTKFGEKFRILRIMHHEVLSDASVFLHSSCSFISSVETGKKNVPADWLNLISEHYKLTDAERLELSNSIEDSKTTVKIDMIAASTAKRSAALQFQRSFDCLDDETANEILKILKRNS